MLCNNWFVSLIVAVSIMPSTLLMSLIICVRSLLRCMFFSAGNRKRFLVAVVLSVWLLVLSVLDSNCLLLTNLFYES